MKEKATMPAVLPEDAFQKATDRETRLAHAQEMLSVLRAVIYPPEFLENESPNRGLSFDIRYGLAHILDQVQDALKENSEAFCWCYEKKERANVNNPSGMQPTAKEGN